MITVSFRKFPRDHQSARAVQPVVQKSAVAVFRIIIIIILFLLMTGILTYTFMMGYYSVDTSRVSPAAMSASDGLRPTV